MGLWSAMFGTGDVVDKGLDLIDNAFYTDQEKAENKARFLKLYEPFKISQRGIAWMFTGVFLLCVLVTFIASFWISVDTQVAFITANFKWPMSLIVVFYFGGGMLEGVAGKVKGEK